jgi:3-hydroxy acid dehydrogenase/malonic semialdehyde reductase
VADDSDVVVVTGATSGIGEACCHRFLAAGSRVVAIGRRAERLHALADDYDDRLLTIALDIRDRSRVAAELKGLPASHAAVTVLVNNAGLARGSLNMLESSYEHWAEMIETNLNGTLAVTEALLPGMITRNRGHVFFLGSVAGRYPEGAAIYGGTKAFLHHMSQALRRELLGTLIRVTAVNPGSTSTELRAVRLGISPDQVPAGGTPTMMDPADVAEAIFMCNQLPALVNVNHIELMPVMQAFGEFVLAGTS